MKTQTRERVPKCSTLSGANLRAFEREKLIEISAKLTQHFADLGKLLDEIVALAAEALDCNRITVWLREGDRERIVLRAAAYETHRPWIGEHFYLFGEDIPGVVAQTGIQVRVQSGKDHPQWIGKYDHHKLIHAEPPGGVPLMVVPLKVREQVIGVIKLSRPNPRKDRPDHCFNEFDENFALALANHMAILVENARLWDVQKGISNGMKALIEALNETDVNRLMTLIPQKISEIFDAAAASLFILDEKSGNFYLQGTSSEQLVPLVGKCCYLPGEGVTGWVAKTARAVRLFDISSENELNSIDANLQWAHKYAEIDLPGHVMMVPLTFRHKTGTFGVLRAVRTLDEKPFTQKDEDIMRTLANNLATSIEYRRLKQREPDINILDDLIAHNLDVRSFAAPRNKLVVYFSIIRQMLQILRRDSGASFLESALATRNRIMKKQKPLPPTFEKVTLLANLIALWRRLDDLKTFNEIGQTLLSELRMDEMLKKAIDIASKLLMCENITVWIKNEEKNRIELQAARGVNLRSHDHLLFYKINEGLTGRVMATGEIIRSAEPRKLPGWVGKYNTSHWGHSEEPGTIPIIIIPLRSRQEIIGVIRFAKPKRNIDRPDSAFNETDERLALMVCQQIGLALEAQRMFDAQQKALEEKNKKNSLAAIGELARGAAHELCNPLSAIKGIIEHLIENAPPGDERLSDFQVIKDSIQTSIQIVNGLRQFARLNSLNVQKVEINKNLDTALRMIQAKEDISNVQIVKKYSPSLPPVPGDPDQLRQVFTNIITNSIQSMSHGGWLTLETDYKKENDLLNIRISDTGIGMSEEERIHALNPFFTTKAERGGSGLGLPICYGIIQQHHGKLYLVSARGKGTTVTVQLPAKEKK
jgi:signal transduction histidine kinase